MPGGALDGSEIFVGSKAEEHRGALLLSYPMENGIVKNWNDMERIWSYIYSREGLNCSGGEHAVLLTESPLNPTSNREKAAELFFEGFNAPAIFFAPQAILSLYASGRTTGLVLDSGEGVTHAIPVYEGFALQHAVVRMDIAGRDVTNQLQLLLRRSGHRLVTSAEMEIVRQIKETSCHVAYNPQKEEEGKSTPTTRSYELPDGSRIELGSETYRAPEVLFQPDLIGSESRGVHDCLVKAVMKSDMDLRRVLLSQMVLAGGSTLFPGFGDRLLNEIRRHPLLPKDTKIRIAAPPERLYSTWIGGSILSSLATFRSMWISKAEYEENGAILSAKSL
eukprot:CAMPEP_0174822050 /NCGR_PEP_ID=MMETSP1107-20130205/12793_1 /TAXON_ID=36770 /ORGANISM="Paraphysomonas vestita, Strain GFlagA" /LENGTH=334 /DNA_ID=CAMNT_0016039971 /DNA_START=70 /DNA_END=1074 /DNA_ORIENTATION=-